MLAIRFIAGSPAISQSSHRSGFWQSRKRICSKVVSEKIGSNPGKRLPHRLSPRPGICGDDLLECRMIHQAVVVHYPCDGLTYLLEPDLLIAEGFDGDFIGGVQHG